MLLSWIIVGLKISDSLIFKPTKNRRFIIEFLSVLFFTTCSKYSLSVLIDHIWTP